MIQAIGAKVAIKLPPLLGCAAGFLAAVVVAVGLVKSAMIQLIFGFK
jgi:hypothetical protein